MTRVQADSLIISDNIHAQLQKPHLLVQPNDVQNMLNRYQYSDDSRRIIQDENLLPVGLLSRLHASFPQHSGLMETTPFLFNDRYKYSGLKGFERVVEILESKGIDLGHMDDRRFFVQVC